MARLLPLAMCAMVALAAVKCGALVEAAAPSAQAEAPATAAPANPAPAASISTPAAATSTSTPPPSVATAPPEPDIGADERAVLLDLRKRRGDLDAREAMLATREGLSAAADARLAVRINELDALRQRLEALEAARQDRNEASWRGLVHIYEAMKPKDAAAIFDDLEMPVLVQVINRMRETKAALVLAAMLPDRARTLTSELAKLRARATVEPPEIEPANVERAAAATKKGVL